MRNVFKKQATNLENNNMTDANTCGAVEFANSVGNAVLSGIETGLQDSSEFEDTMDSDVHDQITLDGFEVENKNEDGVVFGIVTDCLKLNVREEPSINAKILTTINALSDVIVDLNNSTDAFYKVCNSAGIEGYCVKRYIAICSQ